MAFEASTIGEVPKPALALNQEVVLGYLRKTVPGVFALVEQISIRQLNLGQSNPTYILNSGKASWILRKKPNGRLLPSAHQIEREVVIIQALSSTDVPVPRMIHFCRDPSVIGTAFYVMEHVKGTVFVDPNLPSLTPAERIDVYQSMTETLAKLHRIDASKIGLNAFGKTQSYCRRQIRRWWEQYVKAASTVTREMTTLKTWLENNIPQSDDAPTHPTICHGDFSFSNLIFSKESGRWNVRAIVDWELSTLGEGWADVAYACLPFYMPSAKYLHKAIEGYPEGIPSEMEIVKDYASSRQTRLPTEREWAFFKALALFRLASICQGVGARAVQGNASSTMAQRVGSVENVALLALKGVEITSRIETGSMRSNKPLLLTEFDSAGFPLRESVRKLVQQMIEFMQRHIFPLESTVDAHAKSTHRWTPIPEKESLKNLAKEEGLWNLFISPDMADEIRQIESLSSQEILNLSGKGLTNLEYSFLAEQMGQCLWASEIFNCNAPDTGNMEILSRYGTQEQKKRWLVPLLRGEIRSCFAMTEKFVASSDATNIQSRIERSSDDCYVLSGKKWYTTGGMHPAVRLCIFMGKTDIHGPSHKQQSMILVPMDTPGIVVKREMLCFGYDDAPFGHPEIHFEDVKVSVENLLGGEGKGFEMAQSRLGPGRLHHCMRLIGVGKRAIDLAKERVRKRIAFGKTLAENGSVQMDIGQCVVQLRAARLLVLSAAYGLDHYGGKFARTQIAAAKIFVPKTIEHIVDRAIQLHGGSGLSDDYPLARMYTATRSLRIADGPDEVHTTSLGKDELYRSKL